LTLWFKYGDKKKVEDALLDGFNTVPIDTWLQVVPQVSPRRTRRLGSVSKHSHASLHECS
jgi:FKBP12-rapamycin complex-associated protein